MKKIVYLVLLILSMSLFTGCSKVDDETLRAAHSAVEQGAVIIDVRTPKEFAGGHVFQAVNIPIEELAKSVSRVPKNKTLVVYCASGNRSSHATALLRQKGWTVYDVATQKDFEREIPPLEVK